MRFRGIAAAIVGLMVLCRPAWAEAPATRPTTTIKLAVLPFDVLGDAGHEWIGRAIQEGIAGEIQKENNVAAMMAPAVSPTDTASARSAGQSADADWVIFGTVQLVDQQMRVRGQMVKVSSGQSAGSLAADGELHDLFSVEDVLSNRVARLVSRQTPHKPIVRPTLELRGPMTVYQPRYFDGDIMAEIKVPDRYRDEYERYYTDKGDWCCAYGYADWGYGCGWGCGPIGCAGSTSSTAGPVHGW